MGVYLEKNLHFDSGMVSVGDQTKRALSAKASGLRWASGCNSGHTAW